MVDVELECLTIGIRFNATEREPDEVHGASALLCLRHSQLGSLPLGSLFHTQPSVENLDLFSGAQSLPCRITLGSLNLALFPVIVSESHD